MINTDFIIELLLILIFTFILRAYFNIFFDYKTQSLRIHMFAWAIYISLSFYIDIYLSISSLYMNILIIGSCMMVLCLFAYSGRLYKKVIYTILFLSLWILTEILLAYSFMFFEFNYEEYILLGSILSKLILFIMVRAIALLSGAGVHTETPMKYWVILLLIPICSIAVVINIFTFAKEIYNTQIAAVAFFVGIVMLFINIIIFVVYDKLMDDMVMQRQNILYKQQLDLCGKQAVEREEAMLEVRKIKHDMKNHLIYLREMIDMHDKNKMIEYLNNLIKDGGLEKVEISRSGNIVIDALVNYKYTIAKKQGIDFNINITVPYKLPYEDGDICIILGNALDNAIEAATKVLPDDRYIELTIGVKKNTIVIVVKNSYNGITKKNKQSKYITTKKESVNHGLGLVSIQKAVDRYNGEVFVEEEENEFSLTVMLYALEG